MKKETSPECDLPTLVSKIKKDRKLNQVIKTPKCNC